MVETEQRADPVLTPFAVANCVGLTKSLLGITAPWVWTPWQLFQLLTKQRSWSLPGEAESLFPPSPANKLFGLPDPKDLIFPEKPDDPKAPGDLPKRNDPRALEAGARQQRLERRRRGRRATILTSGSGLENEVDQLGRPSASAAQILGETF